MSSIYRRENGTYYIKFRQRGRMVRRSLGTRNRRQAEAEKRALDKKLKLLEKTPLPGGDITLEDLAERYELWATTQRRPQTIDSRLRALESFALVTGVRTVGKVTPDDIDTYKRERLEAVVMRKGKKKPLGPRTVNEALGALRAVVYRAQKQKWYTGPNPFANVDMLPEPRRPVRWLDAQQIDRVLETAELAGPDAHLFFALGIYAGLRKDESLNARWSWFDFEADLIHLHEGHGWKPKTGNRTLPLHRKLRAILEEYRPPAGAADAYLIRPEKGWGRYHRYRVDNRKLVAAVAKAAGVAWATPHTLRHTFASQLVSAGVELFKVSQWLGHKDLRTTQIYAHLRPQDEDINRF